MAYFLLLIQNKVKERLCKHLRNSCMAHARKSPGNLTIAELVKTEGLLF
jgi:hypothetical protein